MKHINNYVGRRGKRILSRANALGVGDELIKRCIAGDEKALQKLGDMGNEGTRILTIMPYIRDNAQAFLKGTTEYNKSLADIYKEAGSAGIAIDKASAQTALANLKYGHERRETAAQLASNRTLENQRYRESIDLIKLKAYIDYHMSRVDHLYSEQSQYKRPVDAQLAAEQTYEVEKSKYLLDNGSEGNLDNLPRKQYLTDMLRSKFKQMMSILFE